MTKKAKGKIIIVSNYQGREESKPGVGIYITADKNTFDHKDNFKKAGFRWESTGKKWIKEFKIAEDMPKTEEENIELAKVALEKANEIMDEIDFCEFKLGKKLSRIQKHFKEC